MTNDWILDVLSDMRNFAADNGLPVLAEHLQQTSIIAATEIASRYARAQTAEIGIALEKAAGEDA